MKETMPLHQRLRLAIEHGVPGPNFDARKEALRAHMIDQGVHGVHATRNTLGRWLEGRGSPPPYWLGLAVAFTGVTYAWLRDGVGPMFADGRTVPEPPVPPHQPPAPVSRPAAAPARASEPAPVVPPPAAEASIPTREDVHSTSSRTIGEYLARTTSPVAVEAILEHEGTHPDYKGGRKTVLEAARKRLAALMPEA